MMRAAALLAAALALLGCAAVAAAVRGAPEESPEQCVLRGRGTADSRRSCHAKECPHLVHAYMDAHTGDLEAAQDVSKVVFFLHVPRTGACVGPCTGLWVARE